MASTVSDLAAMAAGTLAQDTDFIYVVDTSAGTAGSLKMTPTDFLTDRTWTGALTWAGASTANMLKFPDNLADAFSFKEGTSFYLTFVTTNSSEAVYVRQQLNVADTFGLTVGNNAQVTVSNGDGSTSLVPSVQVQGTTKTDSSLVLAAFSATATSAVAPSLSFLKSANAALAGNTVVASGEVIGELVWFGADGTDFKSPACRIQGLVDATPGTGDMPGRLVFSTSIDAGETLTEALRIDNAQRLIQGGAAQSVSNGDGSTAMVAKKQVLGTTKATGSQLLAAFSATATTAAAPSLNFLKSANATIGSNTVVAANEILGELNFFGADGTDFNSAAARIHAAVDATPGTGDMPGRLVFSLSADGAETLTEALRITNAGIITTLAATPTNINAAGTILPKGGVAITDVLNAWIDDATHGSGTVSHLIGNQTITTSSDVRIKKNVQPFQGALAAIERAPRTVSFEYDHPEWGGERAAPDDEDARKWGPNARGRYVGFLAQETIEWAPWVVNAGAGKDCPKCRAGQKCDDPTHPIWHVEYQHLVPMLVAAIKELHKKVQALEAGRAR